MVCQQHKPQHPQRMFSRTINGQHAPFFSPPPPLSSYCSQSTLFLFHAQGPSSALTPSSFWYASLYRILQSVTSILLYGCETWTLLNDWKKKKKIQAFETKCPRKPFSAPPTWNTRPTTGCGARSNFLVGPQDSLFFQKAETRMVRACHTPRQPLSNLNHSSGHLGGWGDAVVDKRKGWIDIKEGTTLPMPVLLARASCRKDWKSISAESSVMSPRRPNWSRD